MKIKISGLELGTNELEFTGKVEELGLEAPFYGNFKLNVTLEKSHHQLLVSVNLQVNALFECDRCITEFNSQRDINFTLLYLFDEESRETDDPDVNYLSREADKIDISTEIYDYAYLDIPFKILCKEECKGLCPKCGADLNEVSCGCSNDDFNPLWGDLKKLRDELENDE